MEVKARVMDRDYTAWMTRKVKINYVGRSPGWQCVFVSFYFYFGSIVSTNNTVRTPQFERILLPIYTGHKQCPS